MTSASNTRHLQRAAYRAIHREEIHLQQAAYRVAHREALRLKQTVYRAACHGGVRLQQAAYRAAHLTETRLRNAAYRATHLVEERLRKDAYRQTHPEKMRLQEAAYRAVHREEIRLRNAAYRATHPEEMRAIKARRRGRKAAAQINDFTATQWAAMQAHYDHRCVYCKKRYKGHMTQDHLTPLSHGGNHTASNIVPSCRSCNSKKHVKDVLVPVQPVLLLSVPPNTKKRVRP